MTACPASNSLVGGLIDTIDCHIRVLAHEAFRELVGPGTTFAAALTAMLTIYIALIGYQLLLGRGNLRLTVLPVTALKIGLIMAFLTSWAAYQTVIFSFLFDGPRELLGVLLSPLGFGRDVYDGVEGAYITLSGAAGIYGGQADPAANILQGGPMLGAGLLWLSAIGVLLITVGVILASKIVLGFLLAIGPVFIALFLFDTTRGLFDGWLRATLAFAIAPLAANVFGAAMLIMMSPFLSTLSENAAAEVFDMGPIVTIGLIVAVFAIVMGMALRAAATITGGFASSGARRDEPVTSDVMMEMRLGRQPTAPGASPAPEAGRTDASPAAALVRRTEMVREAPLPDRLVASARLGQSYRRIVRAPLKTSRGRA
ncbi:MAG: type IV secretion system protein [Caulobacteraceae bacterium]